MGKDVLGTKRINPTVQHWTTEMGITCGKHDCLWIDGGGGLRRMALETATLDRSVDVPLAGIIRPIVQAVVTIEQYLCFEVCLNRPAAEAAAVGRRSPDQSIFYWPSVPPPLPRPAPQTAVQELHVPLFCRLSFLINKRQWQPQVLM